MTATRGGELGRVMFEVFPVHGGNAPGMLLRFMMHWSDCLKFAIALKAHQQNIKDGIDVVPGTGSSPIMFYLTPQGEWGAGLRLILTEADCETWMHLITEGANFATKKPGIVLAR